MSIAVFPPKPVCIGFEVQVHQNAAVAKVFAMPQPQHPDLKPVENWIACWTAFHSKTQSQMAKREAFRVLCCSFMIHNTPKVELMGYRLRSHDQVLVSWVTCFLASFLV